MIKLIDEKNKSLYDYKVTKKNAIVLEKIKKGQKISILSDTMLKAMFQNSKRLKYSAKFLSYFIDVEYETLLENMHLYKNELDKEKESTKSQRCDYIAQIEETLLNIEVNNNSNISTMERNIEYAYKQYGTKMKVGKKEYEYFQVIQFNLNNFAFEGNEKIIDIYSLQNKEGISLTKKIIIIQIYVPNLIKKWYNEGMESLNEREKYILSLVEPNIERLTQIGDEEIMNEYINEAEKVSFEENIGESYDLEWALKDEGKNERNIEIARNMFNLNIDIELISKSIGLSIEELQKLREDI